MNAYAKVLLDKHARSFRAAMLADAQPAAPAMRDYQIKALNALLAGAVYLALEQGLGKTRVLIEYARAIGARRIVIFCPASVRMVWRDEIAKWWRDSPPVFVCNGGFSKVFTDARIYPVEGGAVSGAFPTRAPGIWVFSYDAMSRDPSPDFTNAGVAGPIFDVAFCDEAQYLKNRSTARTKAIFGGVRPVVGRMIAASGTPCPNNSSELYAPLLALAPDVLRLPTGQVMTQVQFEDAFCVVEQRFFNNRAVRVIVGSKNSALLRAKMQGVIVHMKKVDHLKELAPIRFAVVPIEPTTAGLKAAQLGQYDDIISETMTDEEVFRALKGNDEPIARMRAALGLAKAAAAAQHLTEFLDGNKLKIVVWAEHHAVIDLLAERLCDFHPVVIDGRTSPKLREHAVARFMSEPDTRIFIGNIKAAGTGLTLVGPTCPCADEFFVESSYTPGDNWQAASRIHRIGQKDGVLARVFTAVGTIDDRIQRIITRKTAELAELFG